MWSTSPFLDRLEQFSTFFFTPICSFFLLHSTRSNSATAAKITSKIKAILCILTLSQYTTDFYSGMARWWRLRAACWFCLVRNVHEWNRDRLHAVPDLLEQQKKTWKVEWENQQAEWVKTSNNKIHSHWNQEREKLGDRR